MQHRCFAQSGRRGITVLALLLLIILVVIVAFFLIRYMRTGTPAALLPLILLPLRAGRSSAG